MSSGVDFGVHCEICYGIDVKLEDLWVDRDGQRWATCRSCYQTEHDIAIQRMKSAEAEVRSLQQRLDEVLGGHG